MGFLGAAAGSAAGAILSSTRRGARRGAGAHALWMAFGAAAGIEGTQASGCAPPTPLLAAESPGLLSGIHGSKGEDLYQALAHRSWDRPCQRSPRQQLLCL